MTRWFWRTVVPALLFVLLTDAPCAQPGSQSSTTSTSLDDRWGGDAELLLIGSRATTRIKIETVVQNRPIATAWNRSMLALLQLHDRDGNGKLSADEASRLPTPISLRRLLWGSISMPSMLGDRWKSVDRNQDKLLTQDEVSRFYQDGGVGVQVSIDQAPTTALLNKELVQKIDENADCKISLQEISTASERLAPLDLNEDQLISAEELIRGLIYPGSNGSKRLLPITAAHPRPTSESIWLLPAEKSETTWASTLRASWTHNGERLTRSEAGVNETQFAALDTNGDGNLTVDELCRLREQPVNSTWTAEFSNGDAVLRDKSVPVNNTASASLAEFQAVDLVLSIRTETGKLDEAWANARQQMINLFNGADLQKRGYLEAKDIETQKDVCLRGALTYADRDHDGRLSREELNAWLETTDALMRGQFLISIIDFGHGFFECLDCDHDGLLSVRELRTAATRLQDLGCTDDEQVRLDRLPQTVHIAVSHGQPATLLPHPRHAGPSWFLAMDRNGDGDVSREEWKGDPGFFTQYDLDQDGLLSANEATKVDESNK